MVGRLPTTRQAAKQVIPTSMAGLPKRIEWPTLAVALAIYVGFALLTLAYPLLPWWLVGALGGYLVAWHGSLQHEVIHGHPTPWPLANRIVVLPSLWLWLPFGLYREAHLTHHRDDHLTDPREDPESYYLTLNRWQALPGWRRGSLWLFNTLAGRLLLGPWMVVARFTVAEIRRWRAGRFAPRARSWLAHLAGSALVLGWVVGVCGIPLLEYLALFVYPGLALTLLRSFAEHQARPAVAERTAVVEAGPLLSLLFLNNNLHVVHHREPGRPWYALPARWRGQRETLLSENGGYRFEGYAEVVRRYLFRAKEHPACPSPPVAGDPGPGRAGDARTAARAC